ncbi:PREDICTED: SPARC-like protein 1 [Nanorana parkeri]|uniref:SPARC-like protein 1 n=1 Tax=Nanorana parkeri TaxID=125878 RepID=UPI000854A3C2|nr:PREDICTED: SPARC-like protein 1 [Nanorana parkeri]
MDNTGEKMISEPVRMEGRQNTQSMGHSQHKLDALPPESLMNLNTEESKNISLPDLDGNLRHNDYTNEYENEDKSEENKDSIEDTAVIWITGDPEQKRKIQTHESDEQQSGDGSAAGELSEQHANLQMESNVLHLELDGYTNNKYINIPEEIIDEDLKYVLNGTYDNMNPVLFPNETYKDQIFRKTNLEDALSMPQESESNISKDYNDNGDSYNMGKSENQFIKKGKNMTRLLSDPGLMQKEGIQGEETIDQSKESTNIGDDVPKYHNKIIEYGKRKNITGLTLTTRSPTPKILDISLNNRNGKVGLYDHGLNSTSKKEVKNVKTNKKKLAGDISEVGIEDPCANFHCKRGKTCITDGHGNPLCACQNPDLCQPTNVNDRVCGTDNKTYISDCHLFATKCQLEGTKEGSHLHLDYQGACKYLPCTFPSVLDHFPFRMRDWLKNVLIQLYERGLENTELLSEKQRNKVKKIYENERRLQKGDHNIELLVKDFQKNYHMYVYPVHWQFNQLDQHSIDRLLTRSELSALRAPLIPMEHCVTAFLQGCNTNNDKHISLQEWCHCFGIKDDDIDENLLF